MAVKMQRLCRGAILVEEWSLRMSQRHALIGGPVGLGTGPGREGALCGVQGLQMICRLTAELASKVCQTGPS